MLKSIRNSIFVLGLLLVMPASGGKIFKWVDGQGQVHYGEQAPDAQKAESIKIKAPGRSGLAVRGEIEDSWWFKLDDLAIKVKFGEKRFHMFKWSSRNTIKPLLKGDWAMDGDRKIVLRILTSEWERFKPGHEWVWNFTQMQKRSANVVTDKERHLKLLRQTNTPLSGKALAIKGTWHEVDRGFDLSLNEYGFTLDQGDNAREYAASGNWWLDDFEHSIVLEYALDGYNPKFEWMGRAQKWSILKFDERSLVIQNQDATQMWKLTRPRSQ